VNAVEGFHMAIVHVDGGYLPEHRLCPQLFQQGIRNLPKPPSSFNIGDLLKMGAPPS